MVKNLELWSKDTKKALEKRFSRLIFTESNLVDRNLYRKARREEGLAPSLLKLYKEAAYKRYTDDKYLAVGMSLDIETSNIIRANGLKYGLMYTWQIGIGGKAYYGRDWNSLRDILKTVNSIVEDNKVKIVCLVHYLGFEFQFLRREIGFSEVFSKGEREILNCKYSSIYFKDTLAYYDKKLSDLGNKVDGFKYDKIRHSKTELTKLEKTYIKHDVIILNDLFRKELKENGLDYFIKTKTAISGPKNDLAEDFTIIKKRAKRENNQDCIKWVSLLKESKLDKNTYEMLRKAYWGGYNHTGLKYLYEPVENVESSDITSAYIAAICSKGYPYGQGEEFLDKIEEDFRGFLRKVDYISKRNENYKYLVDVELRDLILKVGKGDAILPAVNVQEIEGEFIRDRHIIEADRVRIVCTLEDLQNILKFYEIDKLESKFNSITRFKAFYLPPYVIMRCLELFNRKQELKGNKDKEDEYERIKTLICSIYGLLGTNPVRKNYEFDKDGNAKRVDKSEEEQLNNYNKNYKRFGYYAWAIWVSAYVRQVITDFIDKIGLDFVYSDTDSIKYLNKEKYAHLFKEYNDKVTEEVNAVLKAYGIDTKLADGKGKRLGWFMDETDKEHGGNYEYFKSLGCKRYIYFQAGELHCTVAGIKEEYLAHFLTNYYYEEDKLKCIYEYSKGGKLTIHNDKIKSKKAILEDFQLGLEIPARLSGCLAAYYNDNEIEDEVTDYQGQTIKVKVKSSICLYNTDFTLGNITEAVRALSEGLRYEWED